MVLVSQSQHQASDWISTPSAVVNQLVPRVISGHVLVLLEGVDEIEKRLGLKAISFTLGGQGDKDGMAPPAMIKAGHGLFTPPGQEFKASGRIANFIAQIISPSAEGVDDRSTISHGLWNKSGEH